MIKSLSQKLFITEVMSMTEMTEGKELPYSLDGSPTKFHASFLIHETIISLLCT
jgi:hypothetical protein